MNGQKRITACTTGRKQTEGTTATAKEKKMKKIRLTPGTNRKYATCSAPNGCIIVFKIPRRIQIQAEVSGCHVTSRYILSVIDAIQKKTDRTLSRMRKIARST